MREFIYFSGKARTSGNFRDLMSAGRMDIAIHSLINAFFLSNSVREDVILHLLFYGPPDPPKHLEFTYHPNMPISKKDVAGLLKRMLYKCKPNKKTEVFPGCFIEKKSLFDLIEELKNKGRAIYVLDRNGKELEKSTLGNSVFLIGDHEGLPKKEIKRLKQECKILSIGKKVYFASHVVTILNYLIDKEEIEEASNRIV